MGKVTRKRYSCEFKSRVALEAIRGEQTLSELASKHGVHQTMIAQWMRAPRPTGCRRCHARGCCGLATRASAGAGIMTRAGMNHVANFCHTRVFCLHEHHEHLSARSPEKLR